MDKATIKANILKMKISIEGGDMAIFDFEKQRKIDICRGMGGQPISEMPTTEWSKEEIEAIFEVYEESEAGKFDGYAALVKRVLG